MKLAVAVGLLILLAVPDPGEQPAGPRREVSRRPKEPCPKCGAVYGFFRANPRYDSDLEIAPAGRLLWDCVYCGYTLETPTADVTVPDDPQSSQA